MSKFPDETKETYNRTTLNCNPVKKLYEKLESSISGQTSNSSCNSPMIRSPMKLSGLQDVSFKSRLRDLFAWVIAKNGRK